MAFLSAAWFISLFFAAVRFASSRKHEKWISILSPFTVPSGFFGRVFGFASSCFSCFFWGGSSLWGWFPLIEACICCLRHRFRATIYSISFCFLLSFSSFLWGGFFSEMVFFFPSPRPPLALVGWLAGWLAGRIPGITNRPGVAQL